MTPTIPQAAPAAPCTPSTTPMTPGSPPATPSTPARPAPATPSSSRGKGGRKAANPHLSDDERRRERVLKNRESAMKSLHKKKCYTEGLEARAAALSARNADLKARIRALLNEIPASPAATEYLATLPPLPLDLVPTLPPTPHSFQQEQRPPPRTPQHAPRRPLPPPRQQRPQQQQLGLTMPQHALTHQLGHGLSAPVHEHMPPQSQVGTPPSTAPPPVGF
jgi:hypothetical protein